MVPSLNDIYENRRKETIPWDMDNPPDVLVQLVRQEFIKPCSTLEIGCGMGNASIYLAKNGFDVTGIDISTTAIIEAKNRALKNKVACTFQQMDFLKNDKAIVNTFDFIFDWSVLHHIFPEERKHYLSEVCRLLNVGGTYLSVCFNEKDKSFGGGGKYRKAPIGTTLYFSSEEEIHELFSQYFRILELKIIQIEGKPHAHFAVYALMKKEV